MNVEGSGHCPISGTILAFACNNYGKPRQTSAGELVSRLRFKPGISSVLNRTANYLKKKIMSM